MHLLPIITFGLLFIALTRHLLNNSVDSTAHTSDKGVSSQDDESSIIVETDSLSSLAKLIVKLSSEKKKTR